VREEGAEGGRKGGEADHNRSTRGRQRRLEEVGEFRVPIGDVGLSLGDGGEELCEALHASRLCQIFDATDVDEAVLALDDTLLGEVIATDVKG
jgi:hypothetical protein